MPKIEEWLIGNTRVEVNYPDITQQIVDQLLTDQLAGDPVVKQPAKVYSLRKFRQLLFKKIAVHL